ncbi:MAG TPA: VOC family protein [Pirellulaceae bacterium]|nr:VOC family protein [Pirellulaceae bacterium]
MMSFAHLTIATRDVAATSKFYQAALLWRPIRTPENTPKDADWLEIAPGQQLHILYVANFTASPFEEEFGRHFAIFHSGSDFAALQDRLRAHGAELIAAIRPTPFARFFFRDPNGYVYEVIDREGYRVE